MEGPSWVGIGVHRSGTSWFTDMLVQHPEVTLTGVSNRGGGRKELHHFDATLVRGSDQAVASYRRMFSGAHRAGEFTPDYLRSLWVPPLLQQAAPEAVFLVLVRDPIDRFVSAMNWRLSRQRIARPDERLNLHWIQSRGADAIWGGMYATQLRVWTRFIPRERFLVQQYEHFKLYPQATVDRVWRALGLEPVLLQDVDRRSHTATPEEDKSLFSLDSVPRLSESLETTYRPEVEAMVDEWGIDASAWQYFAG